MNKYRGLDKFGKYRNGLLEVDKGLDNKTKFYIKSTNENGVSSKFEIHESTVSVYTGFKDLDGREIYENDFYTFQIGPSDFKIERIALVKYFSSTRKWYVGDLPIENAFKVLPDLKFRNILNMKED